MDLQQSAPHPRPLWILIGVQSGVSAASLIVEIVAGRMIAPYVGMSLYTWTAIIAVVLAGFSAGHWWGGGVAGRQTDRALHYTAWTLIAAAFATAASVLLLRWIAGPVLEHISHPMVAISVLSLVVFFLPSLFAGVASPVLAVAAMRGRARSERALGIMFAAGAIGAIVGTLMAGFVLVPGLGSVGTLMVVTGVYIVTALTCLWLGAVERGQGRAAVVSIGAVALIAGIAFSQPSICDRETKYYCVRTVTLSSERQDPVRLMVLDHLAHGISAQEEPLVMYTDHSAMLDALPRMRHGDRAFSSFHIGGGSYSVPRAWAARGLRDITVAEIDPGVTQQAIEDFWFDPAMATVLHRDARVSLRNQAARYDVIIGDAFTDIAVPEHLVTQEFFTLVSTRLEPGGIFVMNLIDNIDRLDALAAVAVTLQSAFPSVEVWTEARPPVPGERRIFVLLAGDADSPISTLVANAPEPKRFAALEPAFLRDLIADRKPRVLTDDRAPINSLVGLSSILN